MSTSIKVAWDCECNPSRRLGWICSDTDTCYCTDCDGVIGNTSELTLSVFRVCDLPDCNNKHMAKGYCHKHYTRLWRHGDPLKTMVETHRGSGSKEYTAWIHMKDRCYNITNRQYKDYGGRGITVCERWQSFSNFYEDMGKKPSKELSLERVDNNKGYNPDNCKWATASEQVINTRIRKDNTSGVKGVTYNKLRKTWGASIQRNNESMWLGAHKTKQEAINARERAEGVIANTSHITIAELQRYRDNFNREHGLAL